MEPYPYKHAAIFANEVAATNVADRAGRRGRRPLQQAEKRRFPASAGRSLQNGHWVALVHSTDQQTDQQSSHMLEQTFTEDIV